MAKKKIKKKILLDADIIIHFLKAGKLLHIPKIFKEEKVILDIVKNELIQRRSLKRFYEGIINLGIFKEISFNNDIKTLHEYARLKKKFGDGESACMAYCKYNKDILASSNISEIKEYCTENDIKYHTTMDFLVEALRIELFTEAECDLFIYDVKSKGSRLPGNSIQEYFDSKK